MASARQDLLRLLASKSFRLGQFKLSSGGTSDYLAAAPPPWRPGRTPPRAGGPRRDRNRGWKPKAVGGLTMGADPIVVAVSLATAGVDGFLVRKAEKQRGTGRRIEGFQKKGCAGGDRGRRLLAELRPFRPFSGRGIRLQVVGALCLVEREGGRTSQRGKSRPGTFFRVSASGCGKSTTAKRRDLPGIPW
jgi:orotate phosphoribosyltransferase